VPGQPRLYLCLMWLLAQILTRAAPQQRVALVIGVGHHPNAPALNNPINDAKLMGSALENLDSRLKQSSIPITRP
jgi:hypothetical protein